MNHPITNAEELNALQNWFEDGAKTPITKPQVFLIVRDNFYDDPIAVRNLALKQEYQQYSPPLASQVGNEVADQFPDKEPSWLASALYRYWGREVANPKPGFRHATEDIRLKLEKILNEDINTNTWNDMGDWWNGAFHLLFENWHHHKGAIHHHFKEGDVYPRGWSGLIYLSPDADPSAGTSIWRNKKTGLCTADAGVVFDKDDSNYELVLNVENKFNRLVLFRENVLHRVEKGFGENKENGRLSQTFFFHSNPNAKS